MQFLASFNQLTLVFSSWAGSKWRDTNRQNDALAVQARRLGIQTEDYYRREQRKWDERRQWDEAIYSEAQETGFSTKYSSFQQWQSETARTTAYERRISNYMQNHPTATLSEARGHRAKRS
ncbi:MAG: hypothetical protein ABSA79_12715 [Candidatus Bathyarchaeia archaeon]